MMCYLLEAPTDEETLAAAMALGEAMQLTNFLRDVREDAARGRIYLPLEDLDAYRVTEEEILEGIMSERFQRLMRFEIDRARTLYQAADARIVTLPPYARKAVKRARILYSRILNHIERERYNVFRTRVRTTRAEKVAVAMRVVVLG
jgi:phytoene synthase